MKPLNGSFLQLRTMTICNTHTAVRKQMPSVCAFLHRNHFKQIKGLFCHPVWNAELMTRNCGTYYLSCNLMVLKPFPVLNFFDKSATELTWQQGYSHCIICPLPLQQRTYFLAIRLYGWFRFCWKAQFFRTWRQNPPQGAWLQQAIKGHRQLPCRKCSGQNQVIV